MSEQTTSARSERRSSRPASSLTSTLIFNACRRVLRGLKHGRLEVVLSNGDRAVVFEGAQDPSCDVVLILRSYGVFWKSVRRGNIGFAASYLDGDFEVNDLRNVFRFFLRNKPALRSAGRGWFRARLPDKLFHRKRANTRAGSKRNIAAHYDLGNDFYREWLDESMTYSSALFDGDVPLEQAQACKYGRIADLLGIEAGKSVLEVGCGWGGMAEELARRGADVTAITVSREQWRYAGERLVRAGLSDRANIELVDYRDVKGSYDAIASIEMIEAVGEENWQTYFDTLAQRLRGGGRAAIQAITITPDLFPTYRRNPEFIQRFIFPGGMLPTEAAMSNCAGAAGLSLVHCERFGASYARTLAQWRTRFLDAWPRLEGLGFDERFRRMWLYYLTYCEIGFEQATTDVGIYVFEKS
jgi:cyclopropane-fatty-acyl-phospholipid synthase